MPGARNLWVVDDEIDARSAIDAETRDDNANDSDHDMPFE